MAPNYNFNEPDLMADVELEKAVKAAVAANLKKLIKQKKITQKELAEELGVTPPTMSDYCKENRMPGAAFFVKLKRLYGINIDEFITGGSDQALGSDAAANVRIEPESKTTYEKYCGIYIVYYLDTGRYKGRDTQLPSDSVTYGVLIIYKDPSGFGTPGFRSAAVLGFDSRDTAEDLKRLLEGQSCQNGIDYINQNYPGTVYHGGFELSPDHAFISMNHSNTDKALLVIHRVDSNKSNYIGGIGTINSVSKGRERAPVVQFIGISRYQLVMSVEEIHHCLLLNYPSFSLENETDEVIKSFKALYSESSETSSGLTEYQKSVIVRSTLERLLKKNLERNMFRYGKVSERDDDYWYHSIKDLSVNDNGQ